MKIGEDGYWEREDRHDRETARVRETGKFLYCKCSSSGSAVSG